MRSPSCVWLRLIDVIQIDKHSAATGRLSRLNVPRSIARHDAGGKIDSVDFSSAQQHSRFRLSARTVIRLSMRTHFDVIDRQSGAQAIVHVLDGFGRHNTIADIRLVCHHHQHETRLLERRQRLRGIVVDAKVFQATRRKAAPVAHFRNHEDPVTIEKDGPTPADRHTLTTSFSGLAGQDD